MTTNTHLLAPTNPQEFSDWIQCQVLELSAHYKPSSEAEVYDFLNALEDRMTHANSVSQKAITPLQW
jgi:hypothetical protein